MSAQSSITATPRIVPAGPRDWAVIDCGQVLTITDRYAAERIAAALDAQEALTTPQQYAALLEDQNAELVDQLKQQRRKP